jgi:trehalose 6-phosphate synthase
MANPLSGVLKTDYILSVDRADYTKGVIPRLKSIAHFFDFYPELKGKITFAQICGKSRMNIEAFAKYYWETRSLVNSVNAQHGTDDWQPIVDVPGPLSPAELAVLYRDASVMLVNPVRDGLNLTAKEFVACQSGRPGTLALSPHAGVFDELGAWSVKVNPKSPIEMSAAVHHALMMPEEERAACVRRMNTRLHANPLNVWVDTFTELLGTQESATGFVKTLPLSAARG